MEVFDKAETDRGNAGNGFRRRSRRGRGEPAVVVEPKTERAGNKPVGDAKEQSGRFDPGMAASRGVAVAGEQKVAPRIGPLSA